MIFASWHCHNTPILVVDVEVGDKAIIAGVSFVKLDTVDKAVGDISLSGDKHISTVGCWSCCFGIWMVFQNLCEFTVDDAEHWKEWSFLILFSAGITDASFIVDIDDRGVDEFNIQT